MNKRVIVAMAAVLLLGAGCGDDGTDDAATEPSPDDTTEQEDMATDAPAPSPDETEPATDETEPAMVDTGTPEQETEPPAEDVTVSIAETSLGTVLVDGEGMTLYMFDPDEQGASTCYDDCAANWPPVTVEADPVGGESIDEALLGTTERDDGSQQVTYNDWPLYLFVQDGEPGAVNGQAVNGVWWVLGPDGTPIRE